MEIKNLYKKEIRKQMATRLHPRTLFQLKEIARKNDTSQARTLENIIDEIYNRLNS
jgi:hypothetical protein